MKTLQIDFLISNGGHHLQSAIPVMQALEAEAGHLCTRRVVSLCELRGIPTPTSGLPTDRPTVRLFPSNLRRSPSTGQQRGRTLQTYARRMARRLVGSLYLKRQIRRWLTEKPDIVLLQNDAAFPHELVVEALHARSIPFVLAQEGIRFPLPGDEDRVRYGSNGAAKVAAWGQASADYFTKAGVSAEAIRLTGSPRFDRITKMEWGAAAEKVRARLSVEGRIVTLLTNPVDDQGFCTTDEKTTLVASVAEEAVAALAEQDATLVLKLHGREDPDDYRAALRITNVHEEVRIAENEDLYPLMAASSAAITMASTAGLEAMLFGVPLGVIRMPRIGFVHDYVSSGAALGLKPGDVGQALQDLLAPTPALRRKMEEYIDRQLACRSGAASLVAKALLEVA